MRVQRTPRKRGFTILGNDVLQNKGLSFVARGILGYLLSLPDGAREDVRTLADNNPGVGRRGVAKAIGELIAAGYYVRRTHRDPATGQLRTETWIFDTPQRNRAPLAATPGTGRPGHGHTGTFFPENREKVPAHPAPAESSKPVPPQRGRAGGPPPTNTPTPAAPQPPEELARGIALLTRLGRIEPKLTLGYADSLALAPLALRWLDTGVSEPETRALLTQGLPQVVRDSRALLAHRLTRKLPTPRSQHPKPAAAFAECTACRDPLPRAQRTGVCRACSGAAARPTPTPPPATPIADRIASLRALATPRRAAASTSASPVMAFPRLT